MNPVSLNSGAAAATINGIDDKRQKKRQRKQEKTRKVQSKVILHHRQEDDQNHQANLTDPNNSNRTLPDNFNNGNNSLLASVPSFAVAERL